MKKSHRLTDSFVIYIVSHNPKYQKSSGRAPRFFRGTHPFFQFHPYRLFSWQTPLNWIKIIEKKISASNDCLAENKMFGAIYANFANWVWDCGPDNLDFLTFKYVSIKWVYIWKFHKTWDLIKRELVYVFISWMQTIGTILEIRYVDIFRH